MKLAVIFIMFVFLSCHVAATTIVCTPKTENRINSDEKLSIFKIPDGVQYIFSVESQYKDQEYNGAMVLVGDLNSPDLLFFPELEKSDDSKGWLTGLFYNKTILKNAVLIVEYGDYCSGNGYEVSFKFSEKPTST